MSIDLPVGSDLTMFPYNVSVALAEQIVEDLPEVSVVVLRDLMLIDPNRSVGIDVVEWSPKDYEICGSSQPSITSYRYTIRTLVRAIPESLALAENASLAKKLRVMLYRPQGASIRLAPLSSTTFGVVERFMRMRVEKQTFRSIQPEGNEFIVMSSTQISVETENH